MTFNNYYYKLFKRNCCPWQFNATASRWITSISDDYYKWACEVITTMFAEPPTYVIEMSSFSFPTRGERQSELMVVAADNWNGLFLNELSESRAKWMAREQQQRGLALLYIMKGLQISCAPAHANSPSNCMLSLGIYTNVLLTERYSVVSGVVWNIQE